MTLETANRLVALRKARGLSQEELASELSISRQAISKWERGEASPDVDNIIMLSRFYGVSIDELLGNAPMMPVEVADEPVDDCGISAEEEPAKESGKTEAAPAPDGKGFTGVKTIRINVRGDVKLVPADSDACSAALEGSDREVSQCSVFTEGDTLHIETPPDADRRISFFQRLTLKIIVGVPRSVENIGASLRGGDMDMKGLNVKRIEARSGGGDISARNCKTRSFSLVTGGGDIEIEDVGAQSSELSSGGGDIKAGRMEADDSLVVSTGGGDIAVSGSAEKADVRSGGGDVSLRLMALNVNVKTGGGDIKMFCSGAKTVSAKTGGGDITASLDKCTGIKAELASVGGEAKLIWKGAYTATGKRISKTEGDGSTELAMQSAGGDIKVEVR